MKLIKDMEDLRAIITRKVDDEIDYLIGVGNEQNDKLKGEIEKRVINLSPNSNKRKQEFEDLERNMDLKFANLNHEIYISISNLEKNTLNELKWLNERDTSYEEKVDGIMRNLDDTLINEEGKWLFKIENLSESLIKKMDDIDRKTATLNKLNNFLKNSNNSLIRNTNMRNENKKQGSREKIFEM